jgi:hypothetical protein
MTMLAQLLLQLDFELLAGKEEDSQFLEQNLQNSLNRALG